MPSTDVAEIMVGGCWEKSSTADLWPSVDSCRLPKSVEIVAFNELREDEHARNHSLLAFRRWVAQNKDIQNINTEGRFLLRFLRTKKFSLPMAQQMLLKYLNLRQKFPMYFLNLDFLIPSVNALISSGYLFASPFRDNDGRRVIIGIAKNFDLRKYTNKDMSYIHLITYETLMNDEVNQVMGFTHFGDLASISPAYLTLYTPTEFATLIKWGEQSIPMRHKAIHLLNVPAPVKFAYDFFKTRVSDKINQRMKMYNSKEELHKKLDKRVLPKEYGGTMPMAEMIDLWKKELLSNRESLLNLDNMKLLSDKSIVTRKTRAEQIKGLAAGINQLNGSFRKLEVD
ncbi:retinaldehyde-binding protein 1 isoform X2 [Adelges cooleyi]|nr:retinaldehyde-binding protein 1 isoform X2 [Adelges cooleyi]XP_050432909.1 retinaldehyde-binding protein 1 isoform X2 [Adelges cooleyi]